MQFQRLITGRSGGRPPGRPTGYARSTRRSIGAPTFKNMTVGPVNRKGNLDLFWLPTASFLRGYKQGFSWAIFNKIFSELLFPSFKYFAASFRRVFEPKVLSFICFQGLEKSKKNRVFGKLLWAKGCPSGPLSTGAYIYPPGVLQWRIYKELG